MENFYQVVGKLADGRKLFAELCEPDEGWGDSDHLDADFLDFVLAAYSRGQTHRQFARDAIMVAVKDVNALLRRRGVAL